MSTALPPGHAARLLSWWQDYDPTKSASTGRRGEKCPALQKLADAVNDTEKALCRIDGYEPGTLRCTIEAYDDKWAVMCHDSPGHRWKVREIAMPVIEEWLNIQIERESQCRISTASH